MAKLEVCRVCLASDTQMRLIVNKKIHKVFEKLTELPFVTTDTRPKLVCYICCGLLYNCHQLRANSLRSEQFFQQVMNSPAAPPKLDQLLTAKKYQKTPIVHMNCASKVLEKPQETTLVKQPNTDKTPVKKKQSTEITKTPIKKQNTENNKTPSKKQMTEKNNTPDTKITEKTNTPERKNTEKTNTPAKNITVVDEIEEKKETIKEIKTEADEIIDLDDDFISNIIKKASERLENPNDGDKTITTKEQTNDLDVENLDSEENSDQLNDSDDVPLNIVQEEKRCDEAIHKKKKRKRTKTMETDDIDSNIDNEKPVEPKMGQRNKNVKQETPEVKKIRKSPRNRTVPNEPAPTNHEELPIVSSTSMTDGILCNQCKNIFSDERNLTEHLKLETDMTQITEHKCDVCSKCFRSKCILNRHVRMHTEKYLHKCNVCKGLFTDETFLREHLRNHIDLKK